MSKRHAIEYDNDVASADGSQLQKVQRASMMGSCTLDPSSSSTKDFGSRMMDILERHAQERRAAADARDKESTLLNRVLTVIGKAVDVQAGSSGSAQTGSSRCQLRDGQSFTDDQWDHLDDADKRAIKAMGKAERQRQSRRRKREQAFGDEDDDDEDQRKSHRGHPPTLTSREDEKEKDRRKSHREESRGKDRRRSRRKESRGKDRRRSHRDEAVEDDRRRHHHEEARDEDWRRNHREEARDVDWRRGHREEAKEESLRRGRREDARDAREEGWRKGRRVEAVEGASGRGDGRYQVDLSPSDDHDVKDAVGGPNR